MEHRGIKILLDRSTWPRAVVVSGPRLGVTWRALDAARAATYGGYADRGNVDPLLCTAQQAACMQVCMQIKCAATMLADTYAETASPIQHTQHAKTMHAVIAT